MFYALSFFLPQSRFEGFVSILGISVYANMNLTMTEFRLLIQGNFLNLIKAEVYVAANYAPDFSQLKFYAKVTVDLSGLNKVCVGVNDSLQPLKLSIVLYYVPTVLINTILYQSSMMFQSITKR